MRARALVLAMLGLALFPVAASANYAHIVKPGETLTSIAEIDGLTVAALARANSISPRAELMAGQTLWIPPQTAAGTSTVSTTGTTSTTASVLPSGGSSIPSSAPAASGSESGGPVPTPERVTGSQIAAIADANGVPAALAEAVAWQESGWNNAEVSKIGAVGVMQITPATWKWIDAYLTPAYPLGSTSATENVRAGVLFLQDLLSSTGGNQRLAVAGYFQGLASIKKFGWFRSTRRYVRDVEALAQRL